MQEKDLEEFDLRAMEYDHTAMSDILTLTDIVRTYIADSNKPKHWLVRWAEWIIRQF